MGVSGRVPGVRTPLMLAGVFALVAALSGCSAGDGQPAPGPSATALPEPTLAPPPTTQEATAVPSPSATGQSQAPEVIPTAESPSAPLPPVAQPSPVGGPWTSIDVTVTDAVQAQSAGALPESFRTFLASRIGVEDDAGCTTTEVDLRAVHPDGFVFGSEESDCGGGQAIWGITEGQWHYITQFEDAIPCREFTLNEVPVGVPGLRCLDDSGKAADY